RVRPLNVVATPAGASNRKNASRQAFSSACVMRIRHENCVPYSVLLPDDLRPFSSKIMEPVVVVMTALLHSPRTNFSPRLKRPRFSALSFFVLSANNVNAWERLRKPDGLSSVTESWQYGEPSAAR